MPAAKKKQKASWRTLSRRASEIERKNRGKPTKQSKSLRTQAANLRQSERDVKLAARDMAVDAIKTAIDATPPVPSVVSGGIDPINHAYYTEKVHTENDLQSAVMTKTWEAHDKAVASMQDTIVASAMAAYEAHNSVHHNCVEPWMLTRAEMDAVMAVLKRSGYSRYGRRSLNQGGEMAATKGMENPKVDGAWKVQFEPSGNLSDVRMAT